MLQMTADYDDGYSSEQRRFATMEAAERRRAAEAAAPCILDLPRKTQQ